MNEINLLPWREKRRRERDRRMISSAIFIWLICGSIVFVGFSWFQLLQDNQQERNEFIGDAMLVMDEKLKDIRLLQDQKKNLIERMGVIQDLQRQRTQVVQIFDDIVRKLPEGVYFDSMKKQERHFTFTGMAQSNARVSNLMESLDASDWFNNPDLTVINVAPLNGVRLSQFNLGVSQQINKEKTDKSAAEQIQTSQNQQENNNTLNQS